MSDRKRIFLLISIMASISLIVWGISFQMLYRAAFKEQEARLREVVQIKARMMEAVGQHEILSQKEAGEDWKEIVLAQVRESQKKFRGLAQTGEFTLARREGDQIVFLLTHRHGEAVEPEPVPFDSKLAEPMRRALSGKSGTVVGPDYQGVAVLAAYEPVAQLNLGLVAKIDLAEFRAPFVQASATALGLGIVLILIGSWLFIKLTDPIILRLKEHVRQIETGGRLLRESEGRLRKIIENNSDTILVLNREGVIRFASPAAETLFGRTSQDLLGEKIGLSVSRKGSTDIQILHTSGAQVTAAMRAVEIEWEGEPTFLASLRDISERKKAEEKIQHLNNVIRAIRNVNQLITREKDRDRFIHGACENLVATRGFNSAWIGLIDESGKYIINSGEAGIGESFLPLKAELEQGNFPQCAREALVHSGVVVRKDFFSECEGCQLQSFYLGQAAFSIRLEFGGKIYGVLVSSVSQAFAQDEEEKRLFEELGDDISFGLLNIKREEEQKAAEKALGDSEKKYRSLFENAAEGILIADIETKEFLFANPAICKMLGYREDELRGMSVKDIHPKEAVGHVISEFEAQAKHEKALSLDIPCLRKDGMIIYADITTTPVLINGSLCNVGFFADTTERKKAENERKKLEEQLWQSQKMEAIGTLAGGIAHDFNNLITIMIGNADLILMDMENNHPFFKNIEEIRGAAQRATLLTRQLLTFCRKQIIYPQILNLNEVISNTTKMLTRLIGEHIRLRTNSEPGLHLVKADPAHMEQIIINLAVNARDAMPEGGDLIIEATNVELNQNFFKRHGVKEAAGPYVKLKVRDTGVGMDKNTQARVFDPFFTTKEVGKGTGLGLSMVYGAVKQNKGYIFFETGPGKGTTFEIYLPRAEDDTTSAGEGKGPSGVITGSETILVVEDDDRLRDLTNKILTDNGYHVLESSNGQIALEVSKRYEGTIHLMLTDVVMPGMNGKALATMLEPRRPEMIVVYMSGYTDNLIGKYGMLDPGIALLEKPFTREGLLQKVREVLEKGDYGKGNNR